MTSFYLTGSSGDTTATMSGESTRTDPSISLDAAHAADREKAITYPPRPPAGTADFEALRAWALDATKQARSELGDD